MNPLEMILFASARASAHFALACLEPYNGHLRAKSSFVDPAGEIMHWHEFGDLEGPGWAANAVGGANLLYRWGAYVGDARIQEQAVALIDHVLEDGFIDPASGLIHPYYELAQRRFCFNYTHGDAWLCPGSLARIGTDLLASARLLPPSPRTVKLERAASALGHWLLANTPLLPSGWVPRRITPQGQPYDQCPTGGPDAIYDHSADGLFLLELWANLAARGEDVFAAPALALGDAFVALGGLFGSINHDTYDDHESVAYAAAFRILRAAASLLNRPAWRSFADQTVLPALEGYRMATDRNGVATRNLLWMEPSWDTAYLWENAESAHAYLDAWADTGSVHYRETGLAILRAIANHHHGGLGFLTEGVDWNNHVSQRHHVHGDFYGDINYTEPLLNNLHHLGPTLAYFEQTGFRPPAGLDDAAAIALLSGFSSRAVSPPPPLLQTERLIWRDCDDADLDAIYALVYADPAAKEGGLAAEGTPAEWKMRFARRHIYPPGRFGLKAICLRESGTLIGLMGLQILAPTRGAEIDHLLTASTPDRAVNQDPRRLEVELTYALGRACWEHGCALEMGRALIAYAFQWLGVGRIRQGAPRSNENSIHLMRQLGFQIEPALNGRGVVGILEKPASA